MSIQMRILWELPALLIELNYCLDMQITVTFTEGENFTFVRWYKNFTVIYHNFTSALAETSPDGKLLLP